jgi:tight adherence protein B
MLNIPAELNTVYLLGACVGILVLSFVAFFLKRAFAAARRDKYTKVILAKTEGVARKAASVILEVEARAARNSGRDEKRPFDFLNWFSMKRDLKRAGLPQIPPLLFLGAGVLAFIIAQFIVAAPPYPVWAVALVLYSPCFYIVRTGFLGMQIDSRRMRMMRQLIIFIESVQRAVSVGTAPDEAVGEAIRETEAPLRENLVAIKELLDLGYDFIDAIQIAADRVNLPEFDIFVASLAAQASNGGSIGEVLKEVIEIARSRMDLQTKIATMTAEGRFNAMLLGSLPVGLTVYLRVAQADYSTALWSVWWGQVIYFATMASAVFGAWLAMKIASIKI